MTAHEGLTISDADRLADLLQVSTQFRDCDFDEADLAGFYAEELTIEGCSLRRTDLSDLVCPALRIADSNLDGVIIERADVQEAEILGSSCVSANFRSTKLNRARMVSCDLSTADLDGADLFGADISSSRFRGVDLMRTRLEAMSN